MIDMASRQVRVFRFHGDGWSLFKIWIVNLFLTSLTLGIYSFWGKTRVRQYLFSETEFEDDLFNWHGNGGELLIGSRTISKPASRRPMTSRRYISRSSMLPIMTSTLMDGPVVYTPGVTL